jgi:hypothetical protein
VLIFAGMTEKSNEALQTLAFRDCMNPFSQGPAERIA